MGFHCDGTGARLKLPGARLPCQPTRGQPTLADDPEEAGDDLTNQPLPAQRRSRSRTTHIRYSGQPPRCQAASSPNRQRVPGMTTSGIQQTRLWSIIPRATS